MHKAGWIALVLSLAGVAAGRWMTVHVFEGLPHVEDEMAYAWQAEAYAHGHLTVPNPPDLDEMYVPFVINHNGQRAAKYPPGWPAMLSLGVRLGERGWVNPLLGGLAIWLLYQLGSNVFSRGVALLACALTLTSPFFLLLSGCLHSSAFSLVLSLAFILAWLDTFDLGKRDGPPPRWPAPKWLTLVVAGLSLGLLALTRPLNAVGVGLPFLIHGMILLFKGKWPVRGRVLAIGVIALVVGSFFFVWQYALTGSPLKDPYTLWWPFDKIGFGPGVGIYPGGYTLKIGFQNAKIMLKATAADLFGWKFFSWLFLPFGMWAMRRNKYAWLVLSVFVSLVSVYFLYWAQVTRYGPRYYYEGISGLALVTAAGIFWLAQRLKTGWPRLVNIAIVAALVIGLVTYDLRVYMPRRNIEVYGLYGVHRDKLAPFQTAAAQAYTPALVFVYVGKNFTDYAGLIELEDPWLTTPFIFAVSYNPARDAALAGHFPGRNVVYYSPYSAEKFSSPPWRK